MQVLQLGGTLTQLHHRTGFLVAAALAALASTSAMAAPPPCEPEAKIAPANQIVNENDLVTLNGQPSKDETSYSWLQTAGPSVTLSSTTAAMPMFTAPAVGPAGATLKFTLRVTGCSPAITSAAVETTVMVLNVSNPNQPPVALATVSPASIYTGDAVTLDGSGSGDPDGTTLTYFWEQIDGTAVALSDAHTAITTFTAPFAPYPNGTSLKFKLTVSDGTLQSSTEQIVNVLWQNAAPEARVSCPASVDEGSEFTLDGSASSDPDDGIAAYSWSQTLGGPVAILPLDMTSVSITASAPLLGSPLDTMSFKLEVTDAGGLMDDDGCDIKVNDITAPEAAPTHSLPANSLGWNNSDVTVTWDWFDAGVGIDQANCTESSTSTGEGDPLVLDATCSDLSGNVGTESYSVKVDKTKPVISAAATSSPNAHDWYQGDVTVLFTCADGLSGIVTGDCPGNQVLNTEGAAVSSTAQTVSDKAGNFSNPSNVVTVSIDKTKPTISAAATPSPNSNGWYKDDVTVQFTCADSLSGIVTGDCPADESLSAEGTAVSSMAQAVSDKAGNVSDPSNVVTVSIDKTGPGINWAGDINGGDSFYFGSVPASPTCAATDALSGPEDCAVTGYHVTVGTHTLTATAQDKAGNETKVERQYTVKAWTLSGFYQPVDMGGVWNMVKGGSTVPLKFEAFAANELTNVSVVDRFAVARISCLGFSGEDAIEMVTTGGTSLRYDSIAGQFIQNWQTPKAAGTCYLVTMWTDDGSSLLANFKLK
jgi:PKD domain